MAQRRPVAVHEEQGVDRDPRSWRSAANARDCGSSGSAPPAVTNAGGNAAVTWAPTSTPAVNAASSRKPREPEYAHPIAPSTCRNGPVSGTFARSKIPQHSTTPRSAPASRGEVTPSSRA
ncbi:hypothetical protein GCM10025864_39850 [Luteimicrobium album]|uniref:Uncharacterized protein n=1 Tax=Luteimicrobium album TaxID=1054550 RepID=A0ABQ6I6B8_9MICO|nr:hypothetical protein GCM10025864_39850 [Luteimicrobium album]